MIVDCFAGPGGWDEGIRLLADRTGRDEIRDATLRFEF